MNINAILSIKFTPERLEEYREAFDMFDTDKDQIITTSQLVQALNALGYNTNQIVIQKIKDVDIESEGGVGKLKFEDFLDYVMSCIRYAYTKQDMMEDFKVIDVNGNGRITKYALRNYLKKLDIPLSDEEIGEAVEAADVNKDGWIDYEEFASKICFYDGENY